MSDKKKIVVPPADAAYLQANHATMSVPQMSKSLKRASNTVYQYMAELGLTPKGRVIDRTHPFVRANRQLRATLIDERQMRAANKAAS